MSYKVTLLNWKNERPAFPLHVTHVTYVTHVTIQLFTDK